MKVEYGGRTYDLYDCRTHHFKNGEGSMTFGLLDNGDIMVIDGTINGDLPVTIPRVAVDKLEALLVVLHQELPA